MSLSEPTMSLSSVNHVGTVFQQTDLRRSRRLYLAPAQPGSMGGFWSLSCCPLSKVCFRWRFLMEKNIRSNKTVTLVVWAVSVTWGDCRGVCVCVCVCVYEWIDRPFENKHLFQALLIAAIAYFHQKKIILGFRCTQWSRYSSKFVLLSLGLCAACLPTNT